MWWLRRGTAKLAEYPGCLLVLSVPADPSVSGRMSSCAYAGPTFHGCPLYLGPRRPLRHWEHNTRYHDSEHVPLRPDHRVQQQQLDLDLMGGLDRAWHETPPAFFWVEKNALGIADRLVWANGVGVTSLAHAHPVTEGSTPDPNSGVPLLFFPRLTQPRRTTQTDRARAFLYKIPQFPPRSSSRLLYSPLSRPIVSLDDISISVSLDDSQQESRRQLARH